MKHASPHAAATATDQASRARAALNRFLNAAVRSGSLSAEHVRAGNRQPQSESFVRKALVAVRKAFPAVTVAVTRRELPRNLEADGLAATAMAAEATLRASPELSRYLTNTRMKVDSVGVDDVELHNLLVLYAYRAIAGDPRVAALQTGAASIALDMAGRSAPMPGNVARAADSVFLQSVCEVHALSLRAAHDGNSAALRALQEVLRLRRASGDFGAMSLAPLSHDTSSALVILQAQLQAGKDFGHMSQRQLKDNTQWVAAEGMAAWMQERGASFEQASSLSTRVVMVANLGARPEHAPKHERRPAP